MAFCDGMVRRLLLAALVVAGERFGACVAVCVAVFLSCSPMLMECREWQPHIAICRNRVDAGDARAKISGQMLQQHCATRPFKE